MKAILALKRCGLAAIIAPLTLESVVYGSGAKYRDWVAELTAMDSDYGYARRFLRPQIDYAHADYEMTTGVTANYILETGRVYQAHEQIGMTTYIRYFCAVLSDGSVVRIEKEMVDWCLRSRLESTFAPQLAAE